MSFVELANLLSQLAGLVFVVSSMLALGLNLSFAEILGSLKDARRVVKALVGNFVLVPLLAFLIARLLPLEPSLQIGLVVLSSAAGAPFLPRLVQSARGDVAWGVGMMALLMVATIGYMPVVLPWLLPGVAVNPWDIAQSLIVLMLIPLATGLIARVQWPDSAVAWQASMNQTSSVAMILLLATGLGLNLKTILSLIGSGGILALLLFILGCLGIGLLLGGQDPAQRKVMALGSAQRNVAAAIVVTAQNFSDSNTLAFVLTAAIVMLLVLLPVSRWLGTSSRALNAQPVP
ncbi:MAG: bile acid:sodium symporter family protein [Chloroflexota bacterium]